MLFVIWFVKQIATHFGLSETLPFLILDGIVLLGAISIFVMQSIITFEIVRQNLLGRFYKEYDTNNQTDENDEQ